MPAAVGVLLDQLVGLHDHQRQEADAILLRNGDFADFGAQRRRGGDRQRHADAIDKMRMFIMSSRLPGFLHDYRQRRPASAAAPRSQPAERQENFFATNTALSPPKAKEFDSAASMFIARASFGT